MLKIRKPDLTKLFGAHKFFKPTQELIDEMDRELNTNE
jgi:hypothetical protein